MTSGAKIPCQESTLDIAWRNTIHMLDVLEMQDTMKPDWKKKHVDITMPNDILLYSQTGAQHNCHQRGSVQQQMQTLAKHQVEFGEFCRRQGEKVAGPRREQGHQKDSTKSTNLGSQRFTETELKPKSLHGNDLHTRHMLQLFSNVLLWDF